MHELEMMAGISFVHVREQHPIAVVAGHLLRPFLEAWLTGVT